MDNKEKIYIAGHRGMVGSAIHRRLKKEGFENFVFKTSDELDLRNQQAVADFFAKEKPVSHSRHRKTIGGTPRST